MAPLPSRDHGVNVVGYHRHRFGIAEAGRLMMAALGARGVPLLAVEAPGLDRPEAEPARIETVSPAAAKHAVNLLCLNGNHLLAFADADTTGLLSNRRNIALWFWETDRFPDDWRPALSLVSELWAPSGYVAETLEQTGVPVTRVRLPVAPPPRRVAKLDRGRYGIGAGEFLFCFMFDFGSSGRRKNPLGLIEAFATAFRPGSGAALLLKTSFSENEPDQAQRVREAAAAHPDVHLADGRVGAAERDAIIAGCDCYVSLHRSEGFGLSQAAAMSFARPLIATAYGGSMEFTSPEACYLVDYELAPVGEGEFFYQPDAHWAEPDSDHAARLMREVFEHRDEARERGLLGAELIAREHSYDAAGRIAEARLKATRG